MASIFWDRCASGSTRTVQAVNVDESGRNRIICETGRVLGSQDRFAHATLDVRGRHLTSAECLALAEALAVAADVLDGKRESPAITQDRERFNAALAGTAIAKGAL
jgi:hypothetical protein